MKSRELRYFAKLGPNGKPVPGVLEARLKNPDNTGKSGRWFEVFGPNCCAIVPVDATVVGTQAGATSASFQVFLDGDSLFKVSGANIAAVVAAATTIGPAVGQYQVIDLTNDTIRIFQYDRFRDGLTATVTYVA